MDTHNVGQKNNKFLGNFNGLDTHWKLLFSLIIFKVFLIAARSH